MSNLLEGQSSKELQGGTYIPQPAVSQRGAIFLNLEEIWKIDFEKTNKSSHRRVNISITLAGRNENRPGALIKGILDSGAMSNLWGLKDFIENGFSRSDLVHVNMDMRAANKNPWFGYYWQIFSNSWFMYSVHTRWTRGTGKPTVCEVYQFWLQ